jgi:hypothetical protein
MCAAAEERCTGAGTEIEAAAAAAAAAGASSDRISRCISADHLTAIYCSVLSLAVSAFGPCRHCLENVWVVEKGTAQYETDWSSSRSDHHPTK